MLMRNKDGARGARAWVIVINEGASINDLLGVKLAVRAAPNCRRGGHPSAGPGGRGRRRRPRDGAGRARLSCFLRICPLSRPPTSPHLRAPCARRFHKTVIQCKIIVYHNVLFFLFALDDQDYVMCTATAGDIFMDISKRKSVSSA